MCEFYFFNLVRIDWLYSISLELIWIKIWNSIGYFDGIFIWLGILYYGKCWIDSRFK